MYLWEKLESRGLRNDYNAEFYDDSSFITDDNRIIFYYSWSRKNKQKIQLCLNHQLEQKF